MPELNYGSTFKESNVDNIVPQSWENDVLPPFQKVRTLLNTTKLDYQNVQDNGLRSTSLRNHANVEAVRIKVRNSTGGALAKGDLIYFTGTYSDGTDSYPTVAKAISTNAAATNFFARGVCAEAISDSADGTVAVFYELTNQNTNGLTVGDHVYLGTTAGGWTATRPTGGQFLQVVGTVTVVNSSTGRIVFSLGSVPEFLQGGSSGIDATLETLTLTDSLKLGDDDPIEFGAGTDYWIQYDSGNTQWELVSTDIDGSGTNGAVMVVGDGTNDLALAGGFSTDGLSTPTAGIKTAAIDATSLKLSSVSNAGSDTDKFLVLDSSGNVDFRTGSEVLSDIGAQASGSYQASDAGLTSIAGLTTAADKMIYTSGSDTYAVTDLSAFARTILDDADAAAVRTTIGAQVSGSYISHDGSTANGVLTYKDADEATVEANLTFDGQTLDLNHASSNPTLTYSEGGTERGSVAYVPAANELRLIAKESGSSMSLQTANSEAIYISSSQQVGIGTSSPNGPLEVVMAAGTPPRISDPSASTTASEPQLGFYGSTNGATRIGYIGKGSTANNEFRVVNSQNDAMWFGTNDTERLRIDSSGRLGVNNASPSTVDGNTDVVVVGDGNSNADVIMYAPTDGNGVLGWTDTANTTNQGYLHYLHDGDHLVFGTAAAERMRVNATGVGIGTASPSTLLHLRSTAVGEPILRLENANADANQAQLRFYKDGGSPADNDVLGSVEFWGEQSTNAIMRYGDIYGTSTDVTNGTEDFALVFRAVEDGDLYEAMRLQGRNLGIGTSSPSVPLAIVNDSAATLNIEQYTSNANGPQLRLDKGRGTAASPSLVAGDDVLGNFWFSGWSSGGQRLNGASIRAFASQNWSVNNGGAYMQFGTTANNATSPTVAMTIDSSQRVGIRTASPSANLEVIGNQGNTALFYGTSSGSAYTKVNLASNDRANLAHQRTDSVGTSATTIFSQSAMGTYRDFGLVLVAGRVDSVNKFFYDIVVLVGSEDGSTQAIHSYTYGSGVAGRTYTTSSNSLQLAMASGTYKVRCVGLMTSSEY